MVCVDPLSTAEPPHGGGSEMMRVPSFSETTAASSNALLTAKLSKTLRILSKTGVVDDRGKHAAERGAALLGRIIQGSLVLENDHLAQGGLSASSEGLRDYGKALSALDRLSSPGLQGARTTDILLKYREQLLTLAQAGHLDTPAIDELDKFFTTLNTVFYSEVQQPITSTRQEPILRRG